MVRRAWSLIRDGRSGRSAGIDAWPRLSSLNRSVGLGKQTSNGATIGLELVTNIRHVGPNFVSIGQISCQLLVTGLSNVSEVIRQLLNIRVKG